VSTALPSARISAAAVSISGSSAAIRRSKPAGAAFREFQADAGGGAGEDSELSDVGQSGSPDVGNKN